MKTYGGILLIATFCVSLESFAQEKLFLREVTSSDAKETKEYSYNDIDKLDSVYHIDEAMNLDRYLVYDYNENGNCVKCTYIPYNFDTWQYDTPSHIVTYSYEGNNMVERIVHNGSNVVTGMTTYHYNEKNLPDSVSQIVPATTGSDKMKMLSYIKYNYDSNGRLISDETYNNNNFFADEVVMEKNSRSDYEYDANGNLISVVGQYYDAQLGFYINGFKNEYEYDGNGDKRKFTYFLYNKSSASWFTEHYIVYGYNTRNNVEKCVLPEEIELTWPDFSGAKHQPDTEAWYYFDEYAQDYALAVTYEFHFDSKGSGASLDNCKVGDMVSCYVSQNGDELCLVGNTEQANVGIYDMNGNLVLKCMSEGNINISQIPAGVYMVIVNGNMNKIIKY